MTFEGKTVSEVARWWDERPCNVNHSTANLSSLEYSREVTRRRFLAEPHELEFMEPERWRGRHVLDVGCGIGTQSLMFAKSGSFVTALDASMKSLEILNKRLHAELQDPDRIHLVWGNVEDVHLMSDPPDLIYSFGVLHHTPHPDVALRNLREIAHDNTELRIMLYHKWSIKGFKLGFTNRRIARQSEARANCPVTYAYSRADAYRLVTRAGWQVDSVTIDHLFRFRVKDWREGRDVVAWPYRIMSESIYRLLKRTVGWHLMIIAHPALNVEDLF